MSLLDQPKREWRSSLAPALALLGVMVLNVGTIHSWGFYSPWAFAAVMAALVLGAAACIVQAKIKSAQEDETLIGLFLVTAIAAWWLGVVAYYNSQLYYLEGSFYAESTGIVIFYGPRVIGVLLVGALCLDWLDRRRTWRTLRYAIVLATILIFALAMRYLAVKATPDPVIDVFNLLRDGADYIIAGKNPYTNDIVSPYGTERARRYFLTDPADPRPAGYPPLPLLLSVPPRLFGADVRWSNVGADLIAALAIAVAGFRRGRPIFGLLVTAIYLNLPRMPFIIEQTWYEPMIAALLGMGLVLSEFGGGTKWFSYVLVGLGLTAKQFGLPLLIPLAWARRRDWRMIVVGLAIGGLVILPWVIWSPHDFFDIILWKHLARPLQPQSITVASYLLNEFDIAVPRVLGWLAAGASLIAIGAVTPRHGAATALGLGTALLAFCVFHTQGFPNYFYLVQYLWLLGFVGLLPAKASSPDQQRD